MVDNTLITVTADVQTYRPSFSTQLCLTLGIFGKSIMEKTWLYIGLHIQNLDGWFF